MDLLHGIVQIIVGLNKLAASISFRRLYESQFSKLRLEMVFIPIQDAVFLQLSRHLFIYKIKVWLF